MRYAVVLYFDKKTEDEIMKIINALEESDISKQLLSWKIRPHITAGVFNDIDTIQCLPLLRNLSDNLKRFLVNFSNIGIFNNTNTVFLSPKTSEDLIQVNKKIYATLLFCDYRNEEYYLPAQWVPHCSVAIADEQSELLRATEYLIKNFRPLHGCIESFGLVELSKPVKEISYFKLK